MGPREPRSRRPVFGSESLPAPPRPPDRGAGGSTLDRVKDFLDRAGFENAPDKRTRSKSVDDSGRSTSEIRRLHAQSSESKVGSDRPPSARPTSAPLLPPPPAPPAPSALLTPPPPPKRGRSVQSERSLPSPPPPREAQRDTLSARKKQRFLQPPPAPESRLPTPPAPPPLTPPAPPAPRAPPAPPAPPVPPAPPPASHAWHDYDENDYDGDYEAWDDGYGPVSQAWDDGYGVDEAVGKLPTHLEYFSSDEEESLDGDDASQSPALNYLPPPPPVPQNSLHFPPPPPSVPKGWGKGGPCGKYSGSRRKMVSTHSPWFCNVCNKDLWNEDKYKMHVQDDHIPCPEEGCTFSGPEFVMAVHKLKHVKAADGKSVTDSPEELAAWRSMRKTNFPSKGNLKRKAEMEEKRRQSGALPDPPKVSMLEKLLRRTHGVERGKGYGYKGFGKKGKFKGKGKDGKGKDGKGKDWKGKDGKGKGKSGKKGKGKSKWTMDRDGEPPRRYDHATYSVPLPSVVANSVPLEAPFGNVANSPQVIAPSLLKRGPCRFFERGFCYHGENCQYEHVGSTGANAQLPVINSTAWWALPSSLANRAGRPGEGPAGGVFASLRSRPLAATRVEPYAGIEQRERRDGLLRRLLQPDVERYYSAILQCVRYIVSTDFLRLERPHMVPAELTETKPSDPQAELDAEVLQEDLDDVDMANLGALLRGE